jgi:hypothetical protein
VDVVHAVLDDAADLLEALVGSHARDRVALHQHVATGQQLDRLEGRSVGACRVRMSNNDNKMKK